MDLSLYMNSKILVPKYPYGKGIKTEWTILSKLHVYLFDDSIGLEHAVW